MLIMSFQHKSSLDLIKSEGRYFCPIDSSYFKCTPKIYGYLREFIKEKTGIDSRPIFGWSNLISYTSDEKGVFYSMDLFPASFNTVHAALMKVPFDGKNNIMYILDIPDELLVHHDFFDFACFKCDEDEDACTDDQLRDFIFNSDISWNRDIQTCFPYIDKSFIKSMYEFEVITGEFGVNVLDIKFKEISLNKLKNNNSDSLQSSCVFG